MRLSNKIIEEVVSEVAGEDVIPLVTALKGKKNVSEFKLAETIKEEVNRTRNMLYRLYDHNLVSFVRKKDKKKGWYIYYWTFIPRRIAHFAVDIKKKKLEKLKERVEREQNNILFICGNKCIRVDFEQATNFDFKCPECGNLLNQENNEETVEGIKKEIKKLEQDLKKKQQK